MHSLFSPTATTIIAKASLVSWLAGRPANELPFLARLERTDGQHLYALYTLQAKKKNSPALHPLSQNVFRAQRQQRCDITSVVLITIMMTMITTTNDHLRPTRGTTWAQRALDSGMTSLRLLIESDVSSNGAKKERGKKFQ